MKKWGFLDQNQSEFSFFQKNKNNFKKKIALIISYTFHTRTSFNPSNVITAIHQGQRINGSINTWTVCSRENEFHCERQFRNEEKDEQIRLLSRAVATMQRQIGQSAATMTNGGEKIENKKSKKPT